MKKILNLILLLISHTLIFAQTEATVSTFLTRPNTLFEAITWAPDGRIFTLDYQTGDVFKIDTQGNITTLGTFPNGCLGGTMDAEGNFYFSDFTVGKIRMITPEDEIIEYASGFNQPAGILIDDENQIMYVANYGNNTISKLDMATLNPSPETLASGFPINGPDGLAFSPEGNIISANFNNNRIQTITPEGEVSTLCIVNGAVNTGYIIPWEEGYMTPSINSHNLYTISYTGQETKLCIPGGMGYTDGSLEDAQFSFPNGIAVSPNKDSILITESTGAGRIRLITFEEVMPSSTEEFEPIKSVQITPNPVRESLNISFQNKENGMAQILLLDVQGRTVDTLFSGSISTGKFTETFAIKREVVQGTYLLQININGKSYSQKVVVQP